MAILVAVTNLFFALFVLYYIIAVCSLHKRFFADPPGIPNGLDCVAACNLFAEIIVQVQVANILRDFTFGKFIEDRHDHMGTRILISTL